MSAGLTCISSFLTVALSLSFLASSWLLPHHHQVYFQFFFCCCAKVQTGQFSFFFSCSVSIMSGHLCLCFEHKHFDVMAHLHGTGVAHLDDLQEVVGFTVWPYYIAASVPAYTSCSFCHQSSKIVDHFYPVIQIINRVCTVGTSHSMWTFLERYLVWNICVPKIDESTSDQVYFHSPRKIHVCPSMIDSSVLLCCVLMKSVNYLFV